MNKNGNDNLLPPKTNQSSLKHSCCGRPSLHPFLGADMLSCYVHLSGGCMTCPLWAAPCKRLDDAQPKILGFDFLVALILQLRRRPFHHFPGRSRSRKHDVPEKCAHVGYTVLFGWLKSNGSFWIEGIVLCISYVSQFHIFFTLEVVSHVWKTSTNLQAGV